MFSKQFIILISLIGAVVFMGAGCDLSQLAQQPNAMANRSSMEDPFDPDRPPTAKTMYLMADILSTQGKDGEAEQLYNRIITQYPDFLPAYNDLSALQMRQRRIPEAMKTLETGLKTKPDDPVLLNNMGMCCLIRKEYEKALSYFTESSGLVPENTRYRSNMATVLALMDRREEALALYRQILPEEEAQDNINILYENMAVLKE
jgi:serine/threonine-protein kinase